MDRNVLLAVAAAQEAWDDAGIEEYDPTRVGILVGSAIGGIATIAEQQRVLLERGADRVSPFFIPSALVDTASGQIAIQLGLTGPNYAPVSACATGSTAIGEGAATIVRGQADVVLAGGTEAAITPLILAGFCAMRGLVAEEVDPTLAMRPFDATRAGFVMGEGACILVLEELEAARARGATIYAEVLGYGASNDAHHLAQPEPEATGVAAMISAALAAAGIAPERVGLRQRARHVDAARRPRRDARAAAGLRRPRLRARRLVDEVGDGPLLRRRRRGRGDDVRAGAVPPGCCRRRSTTATPTPSSTSTTSRTRRARSSSTWRCRTRWGSAATTAACCSGGCRRRLRIELVRFPQAGFGGTTRSGTP